MYFVIHQVLFILTATQKIQKKLSNEDCHFEIPANDTIPTAQEDGILIEEANKHEVRNEHDTIPKENVETNQNGANQKKMNSQHESGIINDKNYANPNQEDNEQSGSYSKISGESKEETSCGSEEQIIRQHKFYIHSAWLAVQSSYFRSLFFSTMKELGAKEVRVQISTSEEQAHLMLLEAMYKIDTLDNANVDQLLEVLTLAQKYDVKFVFKKCKYCLQAAVDSLEKCKKIIYFIKIDNAFPDVEDLVSRLQSFLAKEFSPLDKTWQTTSFKELCEPLLRYLLSSDELVTVSENTVFHALMHWVEERGIENVLESQELPSLLSVVRFELIPFDYLYNVVQHNPVAKKLMDFNDHYLRGITYHAFSNTVKQRLPHHPVKRKVETQPFVAFTWVVDANTLDVTDETLKSEFWFCGYKMSLVITHIAKVGNLYGNYLMFTAKLSLKILNLTQESEVSIQSQPISEGFLFTPFEQRHTFDKESSLSSVDITYKLEDRQKEITPAGISLSKPDKAYDYASGSSSASTTTDSQPTFSFEASPEPTTPSRVYRKAVHKAGSNSGRHIVKNSNVNTSTVASKPTNSNTMQASKSALVTELESLNSSCKKIDVKMKLV